MPNWYDNGIHGNENSPDLAASGSVSLIGGFYNVNNYKSVGSATAKEPADTIEGTTTNLLGTTIGGTQLFIDLTTTKSDQTVHFYRPEEWRYVYVTTAKLRLHKNGKDDIIYGAGAIIGRNIAGIADMHTFETRYIADDTDSQRYYGSRAFPMAKSGMTNQIAMVASDAGLTFYAVGYAGIQEFGNYTYTAPAKEIATLPAAILNNAFWFDPNVDKLDDEDADISGTGTGRPTSYKYPGEDIGFPDLPSDNILGLGHYRIFHPTNAEVDGVLDCLWFNPDEGEGVLAELIETIKRFIFKPLDGLVSLMLTPVSITNGNAATVKLGNFNTHVTAPTVSSQWAIVDCGTLNVPLKYGSVLDFSPYVQAQLFLPFVGFRTLNVDQISGGTIAIKYYVDLLTGSGVCFVRINNEGSNHSVLYSYDCNLAMQVPVTSDKYDALVSSLMHMGASVATTAATGGIKAADVAKEIPNAMDMASSSQRMESSGSLGCNVGMLGEFKPYLVLEQPVQSLASNYENFEGFPSNINCSLSDLKGYAVLESIHLSLNGASKEEMDELESLLTSGVVF